MKNTQSFNTPSGIERVKTNLRACQQAAKAGHRKTAAQDLDAAFNATYLFPPCNVVNSLRNDFTNYRLRNVPNDLKVIEQDRDKIKY